MENVECNRRLSSTHDERLCKNKKTRDRMASNISGQRIRIARERKGLGQVDLAAALSVDYGLEITQSDISEIERGVRGIRDFELDAIGKILETDPTWLLRGESNDSDRESKSNVEK